MYLAKTGIVTLRQRTKRTGGAGLSASVVDRLPTSIQYLVEFLYAGYPFAGCGRCGRIKGFVKVEPTADNMKEISRKAKCVNCESNQAASLSSASRHVVQVRNGKTHPCLWDTKSCNDHFANLPDLLYHYHEMHYAAGDTTIPPHFSWSWASQSRASSMR